MYVYVGGWEPDRVLLHAAPPRGGGEEPLRGGPPPPLFQLPPSLSVNPLSSTFQLPQYPLESIIYEAQVGPKGWIMIYPCGLINLLVRLFLTETIELITLGIVWIIIN